MKTRSKKGDALLPDDLDLEDLRAIPGAGKPQAAFHERPSASVEKPLKERAIATTLYLLPNDHLRLKIIAARRGVSLQTLALDALDLLLRREGEVSVERWDTRRRIR